MVISRSDIRTKIFCFHSHDCRFAVIGNARMCLAFGPNGKLSGAFVMLEVRQWSLQAVACMEEHTD